MEKEGQFYGWRCIFCGEIVDCFEALAANCGFVARSFAGEPRQVKELIKAALSFEGTADYDLLLGQMLQWQARVRLDAQCCGFMAELIQYKYNGRDERIFRFSIELANIGSMGNFMSQDAELLRQGLDGYR